MNPCAHHHPVDDLAAFAVDAIDDPAERRAIEGHLVHCKVCRAQLAAHEWVLSSLVDDEAPPASLWDGIAARVGGPPVAVIVGAPFGSPAARPRWVPTRRAGPTRPSADRPGPHHRDRRRPRRLGLAAAAAALVAAAAAAPLAWAGWRAADRQEGQEIVAGPTGVLSDMRGDPVARVVDRGGSTYVVLDELPVLPAGRTYQLWSLEAGAPATSLGLLGPGGAQAMPVTLPRGTTEVAVSNEPAGGSPAPSQGMIAAAGTLSRPA